MASGLDAFEASAAIGRAAFDRIAGEARIRAADRGPVRERGARKALDDLVADVNRHRARLACRAQYQNKHGAECAELRVFPYRIFLSFFGAANFVQLIY